MTDWPEMNLDLDIETYDEVSLEYHVLPYKDNKYSRDEFHYYGSSTDIDVIKDIYNLLNGLKYSEKTYSNIDTEKYVDRVVIKFTKDSEEYVFKFYEYGIYDGYFIFNNGEIHRYYGDFVGISYMYFKDRLTQKTH